MLAPTLRLFPKFTPMFLGIEPGSTEWYKPTVIAGQPDISEREETHHGRHNLFKKVRTSKLFLPGGS